MLPHHQLVNLFHKFSGVSDRATKGGVIAHPCNVQPSADCWEKTRRGGEGVFAGYSCVRVWAAVIVAMERSTVEGDPLCSYRNMADSALSERMRGETVGLKGWMEREKLPCMCVFWSKSSGKG